MEERISIAPFRLDHIDPMQALVAEEDVCVPLSFEYPYPSDGAERYIRWRIDDFCGKCLASEDKMIKQYHAHFTNN